MNVKIFKICMITLLITFEQVLSEKTSKTEHIENEKDLDQDQQIDDDLSLEECRKNDLNSECLRSVLKNYFKQLIEQDNKSTSLNQLDLFLRKLEESKNEEFNNQQNETIESHENDDEIEINDPDDVDLKYENDQQEETSAKKRFLHKRLFKRLQRKAKHFFIGKRK